MATKNSAKIVADPLIALLMRLGSDLISYALGPNLVAEPHSRTWSDDSQVKDVLTNLHGEQVLWDI